MGEEKVIMLIGYKVIEGGNCSFPARKEAPAGKGIF